MTSTTRLVALLACIVFPAAVNLACGNTGNSGGSTTTPTPILSTSHVRFDFSSVAHCKFPLHMSWRQSHLNSPTPSGANTTGMDLPSSGFDTVEVDPVSTPQGSFCETQRDAAGLAPGTWTITATTSAGASATCVQALVAGDNWIVMRNGSCVTGTNGFPQ